MLRFFKVNDPYRLFALLFTLLLFSLPILFFPSPVSIQELRSMLIGEALVDGKMLYSELFDSTAPLASLFFGLLDWLCGRSVLTRQIISVIFLFIQASFFAVILIRNKAYTESTYLPALIFGILSFLSFDFISITPELLGSLFLLMAINNIFKEIEFKIQRDEIILNLGVCIGIASLFLLSLSLFLVAAIIILLIFTRVKFRKYFLLVTGFTLPHLLLMCFYFYNDAFGMLLQNFYLASFHFGGYEFVSLKTLLTLITIPIIFLALAFFKLNLEGRFTKYQSQLSQVVFLWLFFSVIHAFIAKELTPHSFIIFLPSATYFISHYFLLVKRKVLAEYLLGFFLVGIVGLAMLGKFNFLPMVSYDQLFVKKNEGPIKHKKLMLLATGLENYQSNKLAGYFLDWELSKEIVNGADYYEDIIFIKKMFDNDPPEIILDPQDKMKAFFDRIPSLALQYKRDGNTYTKVNN
jgi:hypothetical protein